MKPLGFVNWRNVNRYFCTVMWLLAFVLALVVLAHLFHAAPAGHAAAGVIVR